MGHHWRRFDFFEGPHLVEVKQRVLDRVYDCEFQAVAQAQFMLSPETQTSEVIIQGVAHGCRPSL